MASLQRPGRINDPRRICCVVGCLSLVMPAVAGAQGFGALRKTVTIFRSLPPVIDLTGSQIAVRVLGLGGRPSPASELLKAKLIPLIFSNSSLAEAANNPDRVIEVTITELNSATRVDPQDQSQLVTGTIRAAYRTIDNRTKQSLDAHNLGFDYDHRFPAPARQQPAARGRGGFIDTLTRINETVDRGRSVLGASPERPPTPQELNTKMVDALAIQVAQRVVLTKEPIEVPLPRGRLDRASDLAVAGRWGAMLEELEQTPPLPAADDAYRLYGIGVANEALACVEESATKQRDLVAAASHNYKSALALRPDDDVMKKAENRIAQSLGALDVARTLQNEVSASRPAGGGASRAPGGAARNTATRWDNAAVIELAKAGFKDSELVDAIGGAQEPAFDASTPAGLLELKRAGLSEVVIRAMRQRMQGRPKG
jgi:hypothetical protein